MVELRDKKAAAAVCKLYPITQSGLLVVGVDARLPTADFDCNDTKRFPVTINGVPAATIGS